jgi:hypothetical protein
MTPGSLPAPDATTGRDARSWEQAPVIILAFAQSGEARLRRLLSGTGTFACTTGTGVLPLCDKVAATWRRVSDREGLSALELASIRALTGTMITMILAHAGRSRWCETAFAGFAGAEIFLQAYPATRFVCLHRSCPEVIRAAIQANSRRVTGTPVAQYAGAHRASSAATVATRWVSVTERLLRFEVAHPEACLRARYEDLTDGSGPAAERILTFLNLENDIPVRQHWISDGADPSADDVYRPGIAAPIPAGQIPPLLLKSVNDLHSRIGYPLAT